MCFRKGHGAGLTSSGASTPRGSSEATAAAENDETVTLSASDMSTPSQDEKSFRRLGHKASFAKAVITGLPATKASDNITKEYSEQGRVKKDVYIQYIQAASTTGFALFLLATVTQQASSILGNIVLRAWGGT